MKCRHIYEIVGAAAFAIHRVGGEHRLEAIERGECLVTLAKGGKHRAAAGVGVTGVAVLKVEPTVERALDEGPLLGALFRVERVIGIDGEQV